MRTWLALARQDVGHAVARARPRLSCRGVGCVGCCFGPVPVHPHEVEALLPLATDEQLERAALLAAEGDPLRQHACPLLAADGRCSVYAERPLICRGFVATSDPKICKDDPWKVQTVPEVRHATGAAAETGPGGIRAAVVLVDALAAEHARRSALPEEV